MAATRLIALHINKGKTIAQTLADRTDYSKNEEKTEGGKYISSYECDARTADEQFLLSKRQYEHMTGRRQKHDVIAYQIRQSFKPGEVTPEEHYPENHHSHGYYDPCLWSSTAVSYILEKQEYMGHTVLGKTICENYKTKKRRKAKPEELMIFRDTHEAIVDEETWQLAHRLKRTIRKPSYPDRPSNPLTGLLYCSDCGCKMTHRQPSPTKKKVFDADNA